MPVQFDPVKHVTAAIVLLGAITVSHAETAGIHISFLKTKTAEGTGSLFFHARRYRLRISGIDTKPANVEKIELAGSASGLAKHRGYCRNLRPGCIRRSHSLRFQSGAPSEWRRHPRITCK